MLISGHEHRPRPDRAEARRRRGQPRDSTSTSWRRPVRRRPAWSSFPSSA
ncbi:MAG: hypothetical protein M0C28_05770 [Candidatus Moduliflexus flocculans]|nr:hypothetical protein [Candidatus Moduliflexus flocculans]